MAREPSGDARGFSPRPGPWQSDPTNGSVFLGEMDETGNTTQTSFGHLLSPYSYRIIVHLVAVTFALCGVVGNGAVTWLLAFRVKRNPFSVYILNLAIADVAHLLSFIIVTLLVLFEIPHNPHQHILPVLFTCFLAGLRLLTAISTERCVSPLFPIWYRCHRPAHLSAIVCAVVWGLSLCLQIPMLLCLYSDILECVPMLLAYTVTSFLTLLVLGASTLTLLVRVHCGSRRRPNSKLYRVIVLTVLAFLVLGLPLSIGFLVNSIFSSFFYFSYIEPVLDTLSILNSAVKPVIYFFVGRQGQPPGRKSLRDVLQSALTEDTC